MPWDLSVGTDSRFVVLRFVGKVAPGDLRAALDATITAMQSHGTSACLGDCSEFEGGHSIVDLYGLVEIITARWSGPLKEAVLMPQLAAGQEDVRFWENACDNLGLNVRVFADRDSAIAWLCDPASD